MAAHFDTVDDYLAAQPAEVRPFLQRIRELVHEALPTATEAISYDMPTFEVDGRRVVHVAAWKKHASIYPVPDGDADFERLIAPYRAAKSAAHFRYDRELPDDLIRRIVLLLHDR
jgi:uncharacterized protein YdhG (YjbR/CyaY superfamily)